MNVRRGATSGNGDCAAGLPGLGNGLRKNIWVFAGLLACLAWFVQGCSLWRLAIFTAVGNRASPTDLFFPLWKGSAMYFTVAPLSSRRFHRAAFIAPLSSCCF
jgi:hypothetical protein